MMTVEADERVVGRRYERHAQRLVTLASVCGGDQRQQNHAMQSLLLTVLIWLCTRVGAG
jgi:hypothetical protein